ncbi:MAG: glycerol-3-phosphate 1-O-acyltransferase PlsY [Blastochloris sp.]|nr:glycerol-3-phosphate 1-O-acyltransferase PlsY [Blastochloris sp.]
MFKASHVDWLSGTALAVSPVGYGTVALVLVLFFLVGGIPFGYLAGRMKGVDIRTMGSGNIGATNAFRVLGRGWGSLVFFLDFFKAFGPVLMLAIFLREGVWECTVMDGDLMVILGGVAVVLGHNFSPFMGFKGGKGMASSAGFLFAFLPWAGLCCVLAFFVVFLLSRYVSLGSIAASIMLPLSSFYFYQGEPWKLGAALLLGGMGVWKHRSNIQRLRAGTELRFGRKKPDESGGEE